MVDITWGCKLTESVLVKVSYMKVVLLDCGSFCH